MNSRSGVILTHLLFLGVGFCAWWKLTSIHRTSIQHDDIAHIHEAISEMAWMISLYIFLPHDENITSEYQLQIDPVVTLKIHFLKGPLNLASHSTSESVEKELGEWLSTHQRHFQHQGAYSAFLLDLNDSGDQSLSKVYVSPSRYLWKTKGQSRAVKDDVSMLITAVRSLVRMSHSSHMALPPAPLYRFSFSLVNADSQCASLSWPFQDSVMPYLENFIRAIEPVVAIEIDSQELYYSPSSLEARYDARTDTYYYDADDLGRFVSGEWTVSSVNAPAAAANPNIVVFVPHPDTSPCYIMSKNGSAMPMLDFYLPEWGGITIFNPPRNSSLHASTPQNQSMPAHCIKTMMTEQQSAALARSIITHMRALVGLTPTPTLAPTHLRTQTFTPTHTSMLDNHPDTPIHNKAEMLGLSSNPLSESQLLTSSSLSASDSERINPQGLSETTKSILSASSSSSSSSSSSLPSSAKNEGEIFVMQFTRLSPSGISDWETDFLFRMQTENNLRAANSTLSALSAIIQSLPTIEIRESIGQFASSAVTDISRAIAAIAAGDPISAATSSRGALSQSQRAFHDPTLMGLLYFPEDHKAAVYIPFFIPMAVPLLSGLFKEWKRKWREGRQK